jgi:hypothetical protein
MTTILFFGLMFLPPGTTAATVSQPLPQSAVFLLAGYGTKIDATGGYAETVSQSAGLMSASYFRYIPIHGKLLNASFPGVTTGAALRLRDFSWGPWGARAFALAQAGAVTTGTATLLTQSYGGFVTIGKRSWAHADVLLGIDICKTATGTAYPNWSLGWVVKQ